MPNAKKSAVPTVIEVHDPGKLPGRLKLIGGLMSDDWNNLLANQVVSTLWLKHSDAEEVKKQRHAAVDALIGIAPRDELEGMIAAQVTMSRWNATGEPLTASRHSRADAKT